MSLMGQENPKKQMESDTKTNKTKLNNLWDPRGKLCCRLLSDSIPGYFILIPLLFCWFDLLDKKSVKELYDRR